MSAPYNGRCACGSITATIDAEPRTVRQCWCRQCQQVAGGGPTHNAIFKLDAIRMEGALAEHSYTAASGSTLTHQFCAQCGTPVGSWSSSRPWFRVIRLGFLDNGHGLRPEMAIWTGDAPDWAVLDPALEQVTRQPEPPPSS